MSKEEEPWPEELDLGLDTSTLRVEADAVARMTRSQREDRLDGLLAESTRILEETTERLAEGKRIVAVVALFSGGNDSTALTHMLLGRATHAAHANTGIGIEATRVFVRNACAGWGLPLLERQPRERDSYRAQVLGLGQPSHSPRNGNPLGGFPGPAMHFKMYTRLKERALDQVRNELVKDPRRERVVFVAGRRRTESHRRQSVPENGRKGSIIWAAPLVNWTKLDLNTYRLRAGDVPVNETAELLHMSGECLCGSFAQPGERDLLNAWFFPDIELIRELEAELRESAYDHIPRYRKTWGWGAVPELAAQAPVEEKRHKFGGLCLSCADRDQLSLFEVNA